MKGFVYRIYDNTNGNVYYGSTIERYVSNRICKHRGQYKLWLKGKAHMCKSFDILKNDDYSYNIVEEVECETKYELHNRERYYIENNECVNKYIPNRTDAEYYEDNKEKIKKYYGDKKDKYKEYHKEYNKKNKEQLSKQKKEYYKNNKNIILEKVTCECGCNVRRGGLARHKKTKKHNDLLNKTT